jgi:hypothetical protein
LNLPFPLLGTIEWFVVAEAWFKVNERRSNETVDLDKLVPEIEQRYSTGRQQYASLNGSWRGIVGSVSLNTKNVARGMGKALRAKQDKKDPQAQRYQTRKNIRT